MPPRLRRLIGTIILVSFVVVYAFFATVLAGMILQNSSTSWELR